MSISEDREASSPGREAEAPALAVEISSDCVMVLRREALGWRELARAPIGPDGHLVGASALLRAAGGGRAVRPRVAVWLPLEQVVTRDACLPATGEARVDAAFAEIARATGQDAADLALAIGAPGPDGRSPILAAYAQSCREARAYAEGWGFEPERVGTALDGSGFGPGGPDLRTLAEHRAGQDAPEREAASMAASAVAATASRQIGAPAAARDEETSRLSEMPEEAEAGESMARGPNSGTSPRTVAASTDAAQPSAEVQDAAPARETAPSRARSEPAAPASPAPDRRRGRAFATVAVALLLGGGAILAASLGGWTPPLNELLAPRQATAPAATIPTEPQETAPAKSARLAEPARHAPGTLSRPATSPAPRGGGLASQTDAADPRAGTPALLPAAPPPGPPPETRIFAEIRHAATGRAGTREAPDMRVARLGSSDSLGSVIDAEEATAATARDRANGSDTPTAGPGRTDAEMAALDAGAGEAPRAAGAASRADAEIDTSSEAATSEEIEVAASDLAPSELAALPLARPPGEEVADAVETGGTAADAPPLPPDPEDAADAGIAPAAAPPPPSEETVAGRPSLFPAAPEAENETASTATAAIGAAAPEPNATPPGRNATERAAASAPRPATRPGNLARPIRPTDEGAERSLPDLPTLGRSTSRSVQRAAIEQGISLDRAALIGILNLERGRRALLRLPNGRYERLGVGDRLEGWTVDMIGIDAMRFTRDGEDRTLLLVNR